MSHVLPVCGRRRVSAACLLVLGLAGPVVSAAHGQSASPAQTASQPMLERPRPAGRASAAQQAPLLDGDVLGDPAYGGAEPLGGFVQEQPSEGAPASERTEIRFIYTKDTLFIGVVCYDSDPSAIIVSDARRDASLQDSDSIQLIFDTYRDRQNGFVFGTNPAGIEVDGQVTNEGQGGGGLSIGQMQQAGSGGGFNLNWDGAWEVRAKISEVGWSAEFAIPFKTLRYPSSEEQTWGLNIQRNIRRRNERSYWAPTPRQFNLYRLSIAGTVAGIRPPVFRNFKLIPYGLGEALQSGVNPVDGRVRGEAGGDLKYNLTPALTLDATVNTDFAQVEVDDQQVNLDRFNLYFPEKRPFFLENAGFFSVGNQGEVDLFFSRRIGLDATGTPIPIYGGGRVSGKLAGRWNLGLLNMQTASQGPSTPSNNFGVMRIARDLPNRSQIGALLVSRQGVGDLARTDDFNRTYAIDGRWGIKLHTIVSGFLARTETPGITSGDHAFNVRSRTNTRKVDVDLSYQEVGQRFNPEVGFLTRGGYRKPTVFVYTRFRPKNPFKIQELRPHISYRGFFGFDGFQESGFLHVDNHWQFKDSTEIHTGMNFTQEGVRVPFTVYPGVVVPAGTYEHKEAQIVTNTNQGAPVSLTWQNVIGGYFGGRRWSSTPTLRMRVGETFTSEIAYQRNDVDLPRGRFVTNLVRTRVNYSFTTRAFVQALVQYNDRADLWSANIRIGWLQAANTGLFIVYNDTRYLYDLFPNRPERTDRSLVIKFSRMFDLLQ